MLENLEQIKETITPYTTSISAGLLILGLVGTAYIAYSLYKNPLMIEEDPLRTEHSDIEKITNE